MASMQCSRTIPTSSAAPSLARCPAHIVLLPPPLVPQLRRCVVAQAQKSDTPQAPVTHKLGTGLGDLTGLGDGLGPIGLTVGGDVKRPQPKAQGNAYLNARGGIELGPIGLTIGADQEGNLTQSIQDREGLGKGESIHSMTTEQWRALYEKEGTVDLWVEEEFNAGSRLVGGRDVHNGGVYGFRTGEGPSAGNVAVHKIKIFDHYQNQEIDVQVPEDRYVLWEAEDNGLQLPYACRMGCCTACAVRVKEGILMQPEALGISEGLKQQGYALMCVAYPITDCVLETVTEDEVYNLQFGDSFEQQALDPTNPAFVERDDYGLSLAEAE